MFYLCICEILKRWRDTLLAHCYHSIYLISLDSAIILKCEHQNAFNAMAVSRVNIFLLISFHIRFSIPKVKFQIDLMPVITMDINETHKTYRHQLNRLSVWCHRWRLLMLLFVHVFIAFSPRPYFSICEGEHWTFMIFPR